MVHRVSLHDFLYWVFNGKYVAILERERDQPGTAASFPACGGDCRGGCPDCSVFGACIDCGCIGISGVGSPGAAGVLVGTEEAKGSCTSLKKTEFSYCRWR